MFKKIKELFKFIKNKIFYFFGARHLELTEKGQAALTYYIKKYLNEEISYSIAVYEDLVEQLKPMALKELVAEEYRDTIDPETLQNAAALYTVASMLHGMRKEPQEAWLNCIKNDEEREYLRNII